MIISKLRDFALSIINNAIIAVESSGYDSRETIAARMGCEAKEVPLRISLSHAAEERQIQLELLKLQKQFTAELKKFREEGGVQS